MSSETSQTAEPGPPSSAPLPEPDQPAGPESSPGPPGSQAPEPFMTPENSLSSGPEPAPPSSPDQDRIPVLVKLHLSAPPGAEISDQDKTRLISQSSEQVISRLVRSMGIDREVLKVKTFSYSPLLSLQLTPFEISTISSYPEVEEVLKDKPSSH